MRISLIGPGDIKFHYFDLLGIEERKFNKHIEGIAKVLADSGNELVLLPDRGVCFEIARRYKEFNGRRVYGTVPKLDKDFGIGHLQEYIEAEINGRKVFDKIIDTDNWYKHDLTKCIFGDIILMLGNSLGSLGELVFAYYLYKLFMGKKLNVEVMKKKIHKEIRAGESVPFSTIVYTPFTRGKLNYEIEKYIENVNGKVYYVNNIKELKEVLVKF